MKKRGGRLRFSDIASHFDEGGDGSAFTWLELMAFIEGAGEGIHLLPAGQRDHISRLVDQARYTMKSGTYRKVWTPPDRDQAQGGRK